MLAGAAVVAPFKLRFKDTFSITQYWKIVFESQFKRSKDFRPKTVVNITFIVYPNQYPNTKFTCAETLRTLAANAHSVTASVETSFLWWSCVITSFTCSSSKSARAVQVSVCIWLSYLCSLGHLNKPCRHSSARRCSVGVCVDCSQC